MSRLPRKQPAGACKLWGGRWPWSKPQNKLPMFPQRPYANFRPSPAFRNERIPIDNPPDDTALSDDHFDALVDALVEEMETLGVPDKKEER